MSRLFLCATILVCGFAQAVTIEAFEAAVAKGCSRPFSNEEVRITQLGSFSLLSDKGGKDGKMRKRIVFGGTTRQAKESVLLITSECFDTGSNIDRIIQYAFLAHPNESSRKCLRDAFCYNSENRRKHIVFLETQKSKQLSLLFDRLQNLCLLPLRGHPPILHYVNADGSNLDAVVNALYYHAPASEYLDVLDSSGAVCAPLAPVCADDQRVLRASDMVLPVSCTHLSVSEFQDSNSPIVPPLERHVSVDSFPVEGLVEGFVEGLPLLGDLDWTDTSLHRERDYNHFAGEAVQQSVLLAEAPKPPISGVLASKERSVQARIRAALKLRGLGGRFHIEISRKYREMHVGAGGRWFGMAPIKDEILILPSDFLEDAEWNKDVESLFFRKDAAREEKCKMTTYRKWQQRFVRDVEASRFQYIVLVDSVNSAERYKLQMMYKAFSTAGSGLTRYRAPKIHLIEHDFSNLQAVVDAICAEQAEKKCDVRDETLMSSSLSLSSSGGGADSFSPPCLESGNTAKRVSGEEVSSFISANDFLFKLKSRYLSNVGPSQLRGRVLDPFNSSTETKGVKSKTKKTLDNVCIVSAEHFIGRFYAHVPLNVFCDYKGLHPDREKDVKRLKKCFCTSLKYPYQRSHLIFLSGGEAENRELRKLYKALQALGCDVRSRVPTISFVENTPEGVEAVIQSISATRDLSALAEAGYAWGRKAFALNVEDALVLPVAPWSEEAAVAVECNDELPSRGITRAQRALKRSRAYSDEIDDEAPAFSMSLLDELRLGLRDKGFHVVTFDYQDRLNEKEELPGDRKNYIVIPYSKLKACVDVGGLEPVLDPYCITTSSGGYKLKDVFSSFRATIIIVNDLAKRARFWRDDGVLDGICAQLMTLGAQVVLVQDSREIGSVA